MSGRSDTARPDPSCGARQGGVFRWWRRWASNPSQRRIKAAAAAGWWTVLIVVAWLTLVWVQFLMLMSARPTWYQSLLGPGVSWEYVQNVGFWAIAAFKVFIWLVALVTVWLTLWSRQLGKQSG